MDEKEKKQLFESVDKILSGDNTPEIMEYAQKLLASPKMFKPLGFFTKDGFYLKQSYKFEPDDTDYMLYLLAAMPLEVDESKSFREIVDDSDHFSIPLYVGVLEKDESFGGTFRMFAELQAHNDLIHGGEEHANHQIGNPLTKMVHAFLYKMIYTYLARYKDRKIIIMTADVDNDYCPFCLAEAMVSHAQMETPNPKFMVWNKSFDLAMASFLTAVTGVVEIVVD